MGIKNIKSGNKYKIPVKLTPDWAFWGNMLAKPLIRGIRTFPLENTPRETPPQEFFYEDFKFSSPILGAYSGPSGPIGAWGPKVGPKS